MNTTISNRTRKLKTDEERCKPNDRILCTLCDVYYTRYNKIKHENTRAHKRLNARCSMVKNIIEGESDKPKLITAAQFKEYLAVKEIKKIINE